MAKHTLSVAVLSPRRLRAEELFHASTHETVKI